MCEICKRFICPPACPSYDGKSAEYGRRVGICKGCGAELYASDEIFASRNKILCKGCYISEQKVQRCVPCVAHA